MHTNMSVDFVKEKQRKWLKFDKFEGTIMDTLMKLNDLVDESDPDVNIPNIVHAFQTAERIRKDHPDDDWFHLTGLIHDLGKVCCTSSKCYYISYLVILSKVVIIYDLNF